MEKKSEDCCYDHMTKSVGGQSEPSEYYAPPYENDYESNKWNSNGYDQSGMKGK